MARKKEEKDSGRYKRITNKGKKSSQDGKDVDAEVIKTQLMALGLTLREVPGDGNCLFRALGDQLDGHMGNHCRHRQDTTNFMLENKDDFQPFVEDDVPFDKHISQLSQPGTYAGNDAIVAFARLHQVTVVIHQPNAPLWQIKGWETDDAKKPEKSKKGKQNNQNGRQMHIAYHGGDHYDSIRRLGDTSHVPANIIIDVENNSSEVSCQNAASHLDYDTCNIHDLDADSGEANDLEQEAMQRSGCQDLHVVRELIYNNCGNLDAAVEDLIALGLSSSSEGDNFKATNAASGRAKSHFSRKQLERIRKQERKRASEARRKPVSNSETTTPEETIVIGKVQCLNI